MKLHLTGDGYDITTSWNGKTAAELRQGSFENQGVTIASLPEVYAQKQERGLPKDEQDLRLIRDVLLYGDKPLPPAMLGKELAFVRSLLPERLHDRKAEIHIAANGLYVVETAFGVWSAARQTTMRWKRKDILAPGRLTTTTTA